jgi:UDP-N-acetylglucosamine 3-dehydrogenase
MRKLNVAVIGCGSWGRNQLRVFSDLPEASLVAIADIDENTARGIGEKYHVNWYTEIEKILYRPDIEAVTVCTPTVTHAEIALAAIESGKHVLVEKPMTNTIEEAETLIKAAEKKGVHLAVGFIERFNPAIREGMKIIQKGEIGDVILAHTRRVSRRPLRIGDVGVIKDLAIHDIDIVNQLFGEMPRSVFASAGNIAHSFEDYSNIMINYKNNKSAFIETNWLTPRKVRNLIATGTCGLINIEYINQEVSVENNERIYQPFIENGEPLQMELTNFVNSILNDTPPMITGTDGLKALHICEAALESAKTGKRVTIGKNRKERSYWEKKRTDI